ncbi:family 43 glycosylhydrolase [Marinilactibacillus sp. GCM10026970]|uniref:glycoside hydrolase family 43 protein n=1 Tax=Marinilactibacillus sp. GCM10026970 TaxID=3252642 RepID=UPI0036140F8E
MNQFTNPVIKGFAPDPSICAVGEDYYLVNSTFAYFPGIPIYHSKDLVNWTQIGNVLDRKEQLDLQDVEVSEGVFAPTIRYHEGLFYVITTNLPHGGNFVVTAKSPSGPWSDPYYLTDAQGIDPSLFFDEDGTCYYVGMRSNLSGERYPGDTEIWIQQFDPQLMKLIGVSASIYKGAFKEAEWTEGPHLYKREGFYYLLIAEGGTAFHHSVSIARSEKIDGWYVSCPNNPILTHRHLGSLYPIQNVGHGDMIETSSGQWFLVCLASRMIEGKSNLGRETFLAKINWENGWPVVNPGEGKLLIEQQHSLPLYPIEEKTSYILDQVDSGLLYLKNPDLAYYDRYSRKGWIRLYPSETKIDSKNGSPTYLAIRQRSTDYELSTRVQVRLKTNEEAGIVLFLDHLNSLRLTVYCLEDQLIAQMALIENGEETYLGSRTLESTDCILKIKGNGQKLTGMVSVDHQDYVVADQIDTHFLSTEDAGGFVGCTHGIYCVSPHRQTGYADFNWLNILVND